MIHGAVKGMMLKTGNDRWTATGGLDRNQQERGRYSRLEAQIEMKKKIVDRAYCSRSMAVKKKKNGGLIDCASHPCSKPSYL